MGIDYLDIMFRIEKRLKIRISRHDSPWPKTPGVYDITAGQLSDWAAEYWRNASAGTIRRIDETFWCEGCHANLNGVVLPGFCRNCGRAVDVNAYVWQLVTEVLIDTLGVDCFEVKRDAFLIKDLGAS